MKDLFNPQTNLDEWVMTDWEVEDYIENSNQCSAVPNSEQKTNEKNSAWRILLAVLLSIIKSPLFWFAILAIGLWKSI